MLLTVVVLTHPLRDADDGRVVGRHSMTVGKVVGPADAGYGTSRPFAIVSDQKKRHRCDGRLRFNEAFDSSTR